MATVTVTAVITGQRCEQDRTRLPTVGQNLIKIMMRGKMRVCVCVLKRVCVQVGARAFVYEKLYEM